VSIAGPTFTKKKITVQMLDDITAQIKRYLLVNVATSVLVGLATWLAFLWIGLDHAGVWGVIAALINMIPYVGAIAVTVGAALVGFVQFGSIDKALVVFGASFLIQMLEGYLLLPWLTSRASRISPLVVFVTVLVFAWMWGVWGLLLGVPIVMVVKSVCDHVEQLQPIGELLGD
jgi:predicted PurR-regulated permease PerM